MAAVVTLRRLCCRLWRSSHAAASPHLRTRAPTCAHTRRALASVASSSFALPAVHLHLHLQQQQQALWLRRVGGVTGGGGAPGVRTFGAVVACAPAPAVAQPAPSEQEQSPALEELKRSHTCGEISSDALIGTEVRLSAWVASLRCLGKVWFVVLRDMSGEVQVVFKDDDVHHDLLDSLTLESVVSVVGVVRARPPRMANPAMRTGSFEVEGSALRVLSRSDLLPFDIRSKHAALANEEVRQRYRYLDLRRGDVLANLRLRSDVFAWTVDFFSRAGFVHIETPTLTKPTPESGSREFLVPTRQRGRHFALAQSPQQYKQLLMASGVDRYWQFARCYRDEDQRSDRQPEFTQVDLEMAFATESEICGVVELLIADLFRRALGVNLALPFPRLAYADALALYGTDKPDRRVAVPLQTLERPSEFDFLWVHRFPLFVRGGGGGGGGGDGGGSEAPLESCHHPFTAPVAEDAHLLRADAPLDSLLCIRAAHYDLVVNGVEIGGGSIRIHNADVQREVLRVLRIEPQTFEHLLTAFRLGCPPHGGIALGFDRLLAVMCGARSLRGVLAFPKTAAGNDPMLGCPTTTRGDSAQPTEGRF